jgi:hypothetical protein
LAARLTSGLGLDGPSGAEPFGVLDPACGDGELLLAAWHAAGRCPELAALGLHGLELAPERARAARRRLCETIGGEAGRRAAANVRCADALDPAVRWPAVRAIVANPPWSSLSGRNAVRIPASQRELYRRSWPSIAGWPSLHGAFLERIAKHAADCRASARVLLPASVCDQQGYSKLRERVTATCRLEDAPIDLGESAFPGVVSPAVLLTLAPRVAPGAGTADAWSTTSPVATRLLAELARFPRLPSACFGDPGVHTGNCAGELVLRSGGSEWPALREGRDLSPYRLGPARARLRLDVPKGDGRRFRVAPLDRFLLVTVLVRQTASEPRAALHETPGYFRNTLLACTPPPGLDPAFVVAVLNAPTAVAFHRLSFRDARQKSFPQVKVKHLRAQPFPIAHRDEDPRLHDRVADLARRAATSDAARREAESLVVRAFGVTPCAVAEATPGAPS